METAANFFNMGGYAVFVWSSYGIAAVTLIGLFCHGLRFLQSSTAKLNAKRATRHRNPDSNNLEPDNEA